MHRAAPVIPAAVSQPISLLVSVLIAAAAGGCGGGGASNAGSGSAAATPPAGTSAVTTSTQPWRSTAEAPATAPREATRAARVRVTKLEAEGVRAAAELAKVEGEDGCPTVGDLVTGKKLDPKKTTDPWGRPYKVLCPKDEVRVVSFGADGVEGTADDVYDNATPNDLARIAEL